MPLISGTLTGATCSCDSKECQTELAKLLSPLKVNGNRCGAKATRVIILDYGNGRIIRVPMCDPCANWWIQNDSRAHAAVAVA